MIKNKNIQQFQLSDSENEFINCTFDKSDFSNTDMKSFEFTDCTFLQCDFSSSKLTGVLLSNANFVDCKILGVDFSKCSRFTFSVSFERCLLDYCFFMKNNLKSTTFRECQIREAGFAECDLSKAQFTNCNLMATSFERNNLEYADFRTAQCYTINPNENKIKKAKFSYPGVLGLLEYLHIDVE